MKTRYSSNQSIKSAAADRKKKRKVIDDEVFINTNSKVKQQKNDKNTIKPIGTTTNLLAKPKERAATVASSKETLVVKHDSKYEGKKFLTKLSVPCITKEKHLSVKPYIYKKGPNTIIAPLKDEDRKFKVTITQSNNNNSYSLNSDLDSGLGSNNSFSMDDFSLVVVVQKGKDGVELPLRFFEKENSEIENYRLLDLDPQGNSLLNIALKRKVENGYEFICQISTSNNNCWKSKHLFYYMLAYSKRSDIISCISEPFKVTQNTSRGSLEKEEEKVVVNNTKAATCTLEKEEGNEFNDSFVFSLSSDGGSSSCNSSFCISQQMDNNNSITEEGEEEQVSVMGSDNNGILIMKEEEENVKKKISLPEKLFVSFAGQLQKVNKPLEKQTFLIGNKKYVLEVKIEEQLQQEEEDDNHNMMKEEKEEEEKNDKKAFLKEKEKTTTVDGPLKSAKWEICKELFI
ncbi:hypothetical protein ABK040_010582 [Willaertia magna]